MKGFSVFKAWTKSQCGAHERSSGRLCGRSGCELVYTRVCACRPARKRAGAFSSQSGKPQRPRRGGNVISRVDLSVG